MAGCVCTRVLDDYRVGDLRAIARELHGALGVQLAQHPALARMLATHDRVELPL